jgi:hypothetical protein
MPTERRNVYFLKARSQLKIEVYCGCDTVSLGKYFPVFWGYSAFIFRVWSPRRRTVWKGKMC